MKKICPNDSSHDAISPFSSFNQFYCHHCRQWFDWALGERQIPLVSNNRATRKPSQE